MSTTGGPWPADDSWTAMPPFNASILCVFITPPKNAKNSTLGRRLSRRGAQLAPHECALGAANCNIHKCLRWTGRVGYLALLDRRPRLPFPFADLSCIALHN